MFQKTAVNVFWRLLLFAGLLAGVLFFFYTFENWRGRRAWKQYLAQMHAQGEDLGWRTYAPKPVAEDQNFMATPLLRDIARKGGVDPTVWGKFEDNPLIRHSFDCAAWRRGKPLDLHACHQFLHSPTTLEAESSPQQAAREILGTLAPLDPEFSELRLACRRPLAQLIGDSRPDGRMPNFVQIRQLAYLLTLRASAELALGRNDDAFADACVIQRLAIALGQEPHLVGTMIGCALVGNMALQTFWEGQLQWSDAQVRQFQAFFARTDLLKQLDYAMRGGERAGFDYVVEHQPASGLHDLFGSGPTGRGFQPFLERILDHRSWPRGWVYQNQVFHHRLLQETAYSNYDVSAERVYPQRCRDNEKTLLRSLNGWNPFVYLAGVGIPNFVKATESMARTQTAVNQAALACALELSRRAHGEYPSDLANLVPEFAAKLPHDLITGKPLTYQRLAKEQYLLYSVGWDETDDHGQKEQPSSGRPAHGDWVWPLPPGPRDLSAK